MNAQQARIEALLNEAAAEFEADHSVSMTVQVSLARQGYDLNNLEADVEDILLRAPF